MKSTILKNIPDYKKEELTEIVRIIKKRVKPEYIILFGSYARGDFVEYDETKVGHITESYASDFDILVITKTKAQENDYKNWGWVKRELNQKIDTTLDLIVHNIQFVNEQLTDGVPFFVDIKKEGIALLQKSVKLSDVKKITPAERKARAERDFERYMKKARLCLKVFGFCIEEKGEGFNKAAFELHQAMENFFVAIQRVFTQYNPKQHNLEKLEKVVEHFGYDSFKVFPRDTEDEKHLFELLRNAYVDARYNPDYIITEEELQGLFVRVKEIGDEIGRLCEEKIKGIG